MVKRLTIRAPAALIVRIKAEAKRKGVSLNAMVVLILWGFLDNIRRLEK